MDIAVKLLSAGIVAAAFLLYRFWAWPALSQMQKALTELAQSIPAENPTDTDETRLSEAAIPPPRDSRLQLAWETTESRLLTVDQIGPQRRVLLGSISDVWQPERLLHKDLNLPLFEAMPHIAVGVGLLCTFGFLTAALGDASDSLSAANAADTVAATKGLLSAAGGKFLTSFFGLLVSLLWTWCGKTAWAQVQRACDEVIIAIETRWPPVGTEAAVAEQLQVGRDHNDRLEQIRVLADEQVGLLKFFNTDLAIKIGDAVTKGLAPQMQAMTSSMTGAITGLSDRMASINQDAMQTMVQDFSQVLSTNIADEMALFKDTLNALSVKLDSSSEHLQASVENAASQLGTAMQGLVSGIKGMEPMVARIAEAAQKINDTAQSAAALGAQGVENMDRCLDSAHELVNDLGAAGASWKQLGTEVTGLVAQLAQASDAVEELADEQRVVVRAMQDAGPEVLGAMSQMQQGIHASSQELKTLVTHIKEGAAEYSHQVAALHREMDDKLGAAILKLHGAIESLKEVIDNLLDDLGEHADEPSHGITQTARA